MKRKAHNPRMIAIVVGVLLALGFLSSGITKYREHMEKQRQEKILQAFDRKVKEIVDYTFPVRALVKEEQIMNYATYADSSYIMLSAENAMYTVLGWFANCSPSVMREQIRTQQETVTRYDKDTTIALWKRSLEHKRLALMRETLQGVSQERANEILSSAERVKEEIDKLQTKSPGWRYIIDAQMEEGTICRFVYVAPEGDKLNLTLAGGGVKQ